MKHLSLNIEAPGVISLEALNEQIALEAGFVGRIKNTIMDVVPNLIHAAKKKFLDVRLEQYDLRYIDANETVLKRAIGEGSFANISGFTVAVPAGFNGNFKDLIQAIDAGISYSNGVVDQLTKYNLFLAGIISSSEKRNDMRDYTGVMKNLDAQREQLNTVYGNMFTTNSVKAVAEYGQVVDSNKQWFEVYDALFKTMQTAKSVKVSDVEKLSKETQDLMDGLLDRVTSKTITDMTPESLRSLSAMTVSIARGIEFYAISLYRLSEFKKCYEKGCNDLIKALR